MIKFGFPPPQVPMTDKNGQLTFPWVNFFQAQYNAVQNLLGNPLVPSDPPIAVIAPSPFTYKAPMRGFVLVGSGGSVEFSRGGRAWFAVTSDLIPMLMDDQIRISWMGATPPTLNWFGG